jgi:hypothetical protein
VGVVGDFEPHAPKRKPAKSAATSVNVPACRAEDEDISGPPATIAPTVDTLLRSGLTLTVLRGERIAACVNASALPQQLRPDFVTAWELVA